MTRLTVLLFTIISWARLSAQDIEQGKRYLYYQRYESAQGVFDKILKESPTNTIATYWLGQTMLKKKDSVAAKNLYQNALATNADPLVLVGMGQIALMESRLSEARQRFESALEISKKKDIEIFHAIARANIAAVQGDASYAIQVINDIPQRRSKDQKNAESYLLIGQANRKLIDGGEAVTAFRTALSKDDKLAQASYEIGKVYLSQNNPDYFLPAFEEAVRIDPNYAPAYYELFFYWFKRDINKARDYFGKYYAVSDKDPAGEYDKTSIIYASRDYKVAIDSAKSKIRKLDDKADPRYYKLIAYCYDELKDSLSAKNYMEQYFAKQDSTNFVAQDYVFHGSLLSKFPGNEDKAMDLYEAAVELDTSVQGKLKIMTDAAALAAGSHDYSQQAMWLGRIYQDTKDPSNRDIYDWGYAHYQAGAFKTADSIFCGIYKQKYPDEIFGYLWCARAAGAQDTTMEKGTAVEPYKNLIAFARGAGKRDDYKSTLIQAHAYLASYYANVAKDKDSAIVYLQNILNLDEDNESAKKYIEILTKPAVKEPPVSKKATPRVSKKRKK